MTSYRKNVVGVFQNKEGKYLIGKRKDLENVWQFPQGGLDENESTEQAIRREMLEELGIRYFDIVKFTEKTVKYDFPEGHFLIGKKGNFKGQEQTWFLLHLTNGEIPCLNRATDDEFSEFKWESLDQIIKGTISWKKSAYLEALKLLDLI